MLKQIDLRKSIFWTSCELCLLNQTKKFTYHGGPLGPCEQNVVSWAKSGAVEVVRRAFTWSKMGSIGVNCLNKELAYQGERSGEGRVSADLVEPPAAARHSS